MVEGLACRDTHYLKSLGIRKVGIVKEALLRVYPSVRWDVDGMCCSGFGKGTEEIKWNFDGCIPGTCPCVRRACSGNLEGTYLSI